MIDRATLALTSLALATLAWATPAAAQPAPPAWRPEVGEFVRYRGAVRRVVRGADERLRLAPLASRGAAGALRGDARPEGDPLPAQASLEELRPETLGEALAAERAGDDQAAERVAAALSELGRETERELARVESSDLSAWTRREDELAGWASELRDPAQRQALEQLLERRRPASEWLLRAREDALMGRLERAPAEVLAEVAGDLGALAQGPGAAARRVEARLEPLAREASRRALDQALETARRDPAAAEAGLLADHARLRRLQAQSPSQTLTTHLREQEGLLEHTHRLAQDALVAVAKTNPYEGLARVSRHQSELTRHTQGNAEHLAQRFAQDYVGLAGHLVRVMAEQSQADAPELAASRLLALRGEALAPGTEERPNVLKSHDLNLEGLLREAQERLAAEDRRELERDPQALAERLLERGASYEAALRELPAAQRAPYREALRTTSGLLRQSQALRAPRGTGPLTPEAEAAARTRAADLARRGRAAERAGYAGLARALRSELLLTRSLYE